MGVRTRLSFQYDYLEHDGVSLGVEEKGRNEGCTWFWLGRRQGAN